MKIDGEKVGSNKMKMFSDISEASELFGLSQHFLRNGIKAGTIPHIKSGCKYYINVPLFIEQLNQQSMKEV